MLKYFKDYISENIKSIMVFLSCIVIGIVIGIFVYQFIPEGTKNELTNTLRGTLEYSKQENFEGINIIKNGMISNLILILVIYLCAITFIAPTAICITNIFKGFAIGLYIPTLFKVFGFGNGIISLILLVILPNLIYLPSFIYLSINSLKIHYKLINKDNEKNSMISIFFKEGYKFILGFSIIALSVILEQLFSIVVINMYKVM